MAKKKAAGRPRKPQFTKAKQNEFLEHVREGMRRGAAARYLGFDRFVVDGLIASDPEFAARVLDAERDATEHVEEALFQAAVNGNVTAAKTWLERTDGIEKGRRRSISSINAVEEVASRDEGQDMDAPMEDESFQERVRRLTAGT